jgi:MYXO-CTERM domain-containing protein
VCRPPDCYTPGIGCPDGQQCEPEPDTGRGICVDDPCYDLNCPAPQFCRDGECHDPCDVEDLDCPLGQECYDGTCRDIPCYGVTCDPGQTCDPATDDCTADLCGPVSCAWPLTCDPTTGHCEEPECWDIDCAEEYDCVDGTCVARGGPADDRDGGGDDGDAADGTADQGVQVLATGAGGCSCRTTGSGSGATGLWSILGLALAALAARPRRRSR